MSLIDQTLFILSSESYENWQEQSELLDQKFGYDVESLENQLVEIAKEGVKEGCVRSLGRSLHEGQQTYIGLSPRQLQTPYQEFYSILKKINLENVKRVVDLGAAYGRLGIVLKSLKSDIHFLGIEYVKERVDQANEVFKKLELSNSTLIQGDLSCETFQIPEGEVFFLYDFGNVSAIDKILEKLRDYSYGKKVFVIGRGRGTLSLIYSKHQWLTIFDPIEDRNAVIFKNHLE